MTAPETAENLPRGVRPFVVDCKGEIITVVLPGYLAEAKLLCESGTLDLPSVIKPLP